jgi:hypothetical protein
MPLGALKEIGVDLDSLHPLTSFAMQRWIAPQVTLRRIERPESPAPLVVQVLIPVQDVSQATVAFGNDIVGHPIARVRGGAVRAEWDADEIVDHAVGTFLFGADGVVEFWRLEALWAAYDRRKLARIVMRRFPKKSAFFLRLQGDLQDQFDDEVAGAFYRVAIECREERRRDVDGAVPALLVKDNLGMGIDSPRSKRRTMPLHSVLEQSSSSPIHIGLACDDVDRARTFSTEDPPDGELELADLRATAAVYPGLTRRDREVLRVYIDAIGAGFEDDLKAYCRKRKIKYAAFSKAWQRLLGRGVLQRQRTMSELPSTSARRE